MGTNVKLMRCVQSLLFMFLHILDCNNAILPFSYRAGVFRNHRKLFSSLRAQFRPLPSIEVAKYFTILSYRPLKSLYSNFTIYCQVLY